MSFTVDVNKNKHLIAALPAQGAKPWITVTGADQFRHLLRAVRISHLGAESYRVMD
jgi:hypothetical protein